MDISILEDKKNRLLFTISDTSHTLCNAIRKELWNDEHIKIAGYSIDHPLIRIPRFVLETDGEDPRKTLLAAIKRLDKTFTKIATSAENIK